MVHYRAGVKGGANGRVKVWWGLRVVGIKNVVVVKGVKVLKGGSKEMVGVKGK